MQNKFQRSGYNDEALQVVLRVLLHLYRGLLPRPQQISNSVDVQVPSVKRYSAVAPRHIKDSTNHGSDQLNSWMWNPWLPRADCASNRIMIMPQILKYTS